MTRTVKVLLTLLAISTCALTNGQTASVIANGKFDDMSGWKFNTPSNGSVEILTGQLIVTGVNRDEGEIVPHMEAATVYAYQEIEVTKPGSLTFQLISYTSSDTNCNDYPVFVLNDNLLKLYEDGTVESSSSSREKQICNGFATGNTITYIVKLQPGKHKVGLGVHTIDGYYGKGVAVFDNVMFIPEKK
ncbi:MAG: hypothetical protein RMJ44_10370 [Cytophagales bacterium]|nr:hypothetical protein [Bernardetiaceae bacterium]MDW8211479.1 hypothetical protein [Cytophagales bacterium]